MIMTSLDFLLEPFLAVTRRPFAFAVRPFALQPRALAHAHDVLMRDSSSCVSIVNIGHFPLSEKRKREKDGKTYHVPTDTMRNVPMAQLAATNGSVGH